jgi:TonB family protein
MRVAREEIVDRSAASRLGSRRAYLEALLSVSPAGDSRWRLAAALAHRRQLARRIRSLAVEVPMSTRHTLLAILVVAAGITGTAYAAARTFPVWSPPAATVGSLPDDNVEKPVPTRKGAAAAAAGTFPVQGAASAPVAAGTEDTVEKPVPTKKVEAVYPAEAKEKHVEGDVELMVKIGADGLVKDATVQKSVPPLDDAALAAIRQWEFRAGRVNGKPVEVMTTITFAFRLK